MGNTGSEDYVSPSEDSVRDESIPPTNGFMFSEYYLPAEVVIQILFHVDERTLKNSCRLVCRNWKYLVDAYVLRYKAKEEASLVLEDGSPVLKKLKWFDYYALVHRKPFGKNLLKNNCGEDKLVSWKVLGNGGDGWIVESKPRGADDLPPLDTFGNPSPDFRGLTSCFATSYYPCSKSQIIELESLGLTPNIMDHVQPKIEISEWVACRFDCGSLYNLSVTLCDESGATLKNVELNEDFSEHPRQVWKKICTSFEDYGPGVRSINFHHYGKDTQFWKGHYGSKMSGGVVKVLPRRVSTRVPSCML